MIVSTFFAYLRSRLFGPKDYFERQKARLTRSMIIPLFLIVGTPFILVGILSNLQFVELNTKGTILRFLGAASSDTLILAVSAVVVFTFALGCNFFSGF